MLVVRVEVWPNGDEHRAMEVGRMEVANTSKLSPISDYKYRIIGAGAPRLRGEIIGHKRQAGAWDLVRRILEHSHAAA